MEYSGCTTTNVANVHVWTLETPLPAQRAQATGQANLFEAL